MAYALRDGVSFCVAGERHFFLDRTANRYFALGESDERLFLQLTALEGPAREALALSPALSRLLRGGSAWNLRPCTRMAAPGAGLEDRALCRPAPWLVLRAALSFIAMKRSLRRHTPGAILGQLRHGRQARMADATGEETLFHLAAAFEEVRVWASQDECLALSLAYARLAQALGYRVDIVFGITPRPFGAHCWVQREEIVLNDRLARVLPFTPIYVQ